MKLKYIIFSQLFQSEILSLNRSFKTRDRMREDKVLFTKGLEVYLSAKIS